VKVLLRRCRLANLVLLFSVTVLSCSGCSLNTTDIDVVEVLLPEQDRAEEGKARGSS
jgi:hypothetical protein